MDSMFQTIKSSIIKQGGHDNVYVLNLQNIEVNQITSQAKKLMQMCKNLYQLNLQGCKLKNLNNLPLIDLTIIVLQNNELKQEQLQKLSIYPNLVQLNIKQNKMRMLSYCCNILSRFTKLQQLDIHGNILCSSIHQYHQKIFQSLSQTCPSLKIIDCYCKNGEILSDEENKDQDLLDEEYYDGQDIQDKQSDQLSEGGLFVDPIDNCLDEEQNDLQLEIMDNQYYEDCNININGYKKIKEQ